MTRHIYLRSFAGVGRISVLPGHPLEGQQGAVRRIRRSDGGAWVEMFEPLPDDMASFPVGDHRRNHIILYPEECEAAQ